MSTTRTEAGTAPRGVSAEVLVAGLVAALSGGVLVPLLFSGDAPVDASIHLVGWSALAVGGALLLDRFPGSRLGRTMVALAFVPFLLLAWGVTRFGSWPTWDEVLRAVRELGPGPLLLALAALVWATGRPGGRQSRRRLVWLFVTAGSAAAIGTVAWVLTTEPVTGLIASGVLVAVVLAVVGLALAEDFRPLDEPLLDVAVVAGSLTSGVLVALLVKLGGTWVSVPAANTSAAFAGLTTAALAVPAALWLRRSVLERRYGPGALSPADVAMITADLHTQTDPRLLLGKAANMVAAASGHRQLRIVLGDEVPPVPQRWVVHPLVVGGDRVGALLLDPQHLEGPEPRQERVVAQLLPTVALVAKAVDLAVEAEHARQDLARERDAERARILGDLHDGLGPVLAGMSMRVQAALRTEQLPLLRDLATELAECRGDLRRIVSGLVPSALHHSDLGPALDQLVGSFTDAGAGTTVTLESSLARGLAPEVAVAVYRTVAEGITNALRHAQARSVTVNVRAGSAGAYVDVEDDGVGGPVVPGVGLTSLRRRAEQLGGTLDVAACNGTGTRLHLALPTTGGGA